MEGPRELEARRTFPRANRQHAVIASRVLARHASSIGGPITLPVPIELIIEQTYGLEILWEEIPEPLGSVILGALAPRDRRIVLNSRHEAFYEQWLGPERFTLAHELAHWIYDAENPDQLTMDLDSQPAEQYCYHRESPGLSETLRIREVNANKLAANLLLPEDLVRSADIEEVLADFRGTAASWQVSLTTLRIRLRELGLIDGYDEAQLGLV